MLRRAGLSLLLALLLCGASAVWAADDLARYEQRLFMQSYAGESAEVRIERLEKRIFGIAQPGNLQQRRDRLVRILGEADAVVPDAKPVQTQTQPQPASRPPEKQPDATDYPTVTALEREVFGRDFVRDDIGSRLSRLEKRVFRQEYPNLALVDRVDKLLMRHPNVQADSVISSVSPPTASVLDNLPNDPSQFSASSRDAYIKVDELEKAHFHGQTYPNQLLTERLDRLENVQFGRVYGGESVDIRLNRLLNHFNSVASRPARQPAPSYQPDGYSSQSYSSQGYGGAAQQDVRRQNIQIGAGIASTSSYGFSPELLRMLPPDIRQQVMAQNGQAPPVQQQQSYSGFQTYGGAPIQYRNYYDLGPQAGSVPGATSTTLVNPDGSTTVYGYPGNPAVLKSLDDLESKVLGKAYVEEPVPSRLTRLETVMLGHPYMNLPDAERIDTLQRAYRYHSLGQLLNPGAQASPADGNGEQPKAPQSLGIPLSN